MLAALDRSDRLLLVCTPEVTSLKNVRIGLETIDRLGYPRERVALVANRLGAAGGVELVDDYAHHPTEVLATIHPAVPETINRATPAVLAEPGSKFSRAATKMAGALFAGAPAASSKKSSQARKSLIRGRR